MTTKLSPARVVGRRHAAEDLRSTLDTLVKGGHGGATRRAVAERLSISHTHVDRLCGDGEPALACGDVEAMGAEIAVAYYTRRLLRLRAPREEGAAHDLRDLALDTIAATGVFADRVRTSLLDGHLDDDELARIDAAAHTLQAKVQAVLAACAQIRCARRPRR